MMNKTNLIKTTRTALGISQEDFGRWLAEKVERSHPFSKQQVYAWEAGIKSPRKNIRNACNPIACEKIADDAIELVLKADSPDKLTEARDTIALKISNL